MSSIRHMYITDSAYDGLIFWVPLSLSYPSSPVLSDEYPCTRVSVIFQVFLHHFVLAKLATSSIRVNIDLILPVSFV